MRDPRGVDRCTASYDMPAVIKDSIKSGGDPKNGIEINYDTNNSTECVSEQDAIVLVTTADPMPSETTINSDVDKDEDENAVNVNETVKSAKVNDAPNEEVEQKKKSNGKNSSKSESEDKFMVDVSACEKPPELMNGIEYNSDDGVNNKIRSSTESLAADDNGEIECNDRRSNKTTAAATKSNKRKISISSEDEQPPPAKK